MYFFFKDKRKRKNFFFVESERFQNQEKLSSKAQVMKIEG